MFMCATNSSWQQSTESVTVDNDEKGELTSIRQSGDYILHTSCPKKWHKMWFPVNANKKAPTDRQPPIASRGKGSEKSRVILFSMACS